MLQKPKPIAGAVTLTIAANKPDRRRRDMDALPKALLDLAVNHGLITDDSLVTSHSSKITAYLPAANAAAIVTRTCSSPYPAPAHLQAIPW